MEFDPIRRKGEINRYEASGQFNQRQFFVGFNSRSEQNVPAQRQLFAEQDD